MADQLRSISAKKLADEVKAAVAKNETLKGLVADPKAVTAALDHRPHPASGRLGK